VAKNCLYCGQPLAKEDARFCNECGRLQIPEPAPPEGPAPIKVRLPPKEFSARREPPPFQPISGQSMPETVRSSRQETPASGAPSSRSPKRPVRLTGQEALAANKQPEFPGEEAQAPTRASGSARPEKTQPAPVEELSTMVLPGWREELEHLRKEQAATSAPAAPQKQPELPSSQKPFSVPRRSESNVAYVPQESQGAKKNSPEDVPSRSTQESKTSEEQPRSPGDQDRRELRVKVWEQEPTIQYPQVHVEKKEASPLPAVEHAPFANLAFDQEEQIADQATLDWQTFPNASLTNTASSREQEAEQAPVSWQAFPAPSTPPASASSEAIEKAPTQQLANEPKERRTPPPADASEKTQIQQPANEPKERRTPPPADASEKTQTWQNAGELKEKRTPAPAEAVEKERGGSDIEDLPTARLAVPEAARHSSITIERASTPAPTKRTPPQPAEVEDLPTRPLAAASSAGPRSPIPPVAPQPSQNREQGERETRPAPISMVPNPPSSPGAYGPPSTLQARGVSHAPDAIIGAPATRGPVNPPSQPGQVFNPPSLPPLPQGPASLPGNTPFKAETAGAPQRPPVLAPATPPPMLTPRATTPPTEAAVATREKKRVRPALVALLILLVLVVGGSAFAIYYQSTSGAAQAYQAFQNNTLGVALNYPQGWTSSLNKTQTSAHFADSTQTGQITLSMTATNGQQASQYLNQEITQLGINGQQAKPASTFGGANWQTVQGNVVQRGATYTIVLYVAQHGNNFYALAFMAPLPVYGQMDQENFAPLRSSFRFL
jgi:hypothetical protein